MRTDTYELPTSSYNLGKTVFLLGMSKDGPVNSPVSVSSMQEAVSIFGAAEHGDLIRAYDQASRISGITVYLMRISGEYAKGSLTGVTESGSFPVVKMRSIYGGEQYNLVQIHIEEVITEGVAQHLLTFQLDDIGMMSRQYALENYQTIQELMTAINYDTRYKMNAVWVTSEYAHFPASSLIDGYTAPVTLSDGADGLALSKDDLYLALEQSYEILEGRAIDIVCPVGARFDDAHPTYYSQGSFNYGDAVSYVDSTRQYLSLIDTENNNRFVTYHEQLVNFCKSQQSFGFTTHGVMGMHELDMTNAREGYIARLAKATALGTRFGFVERDTIGAYDYGHFVSIFAHTLSFEEYTQNGCALYAAFLASLPPHETATNKQLPANITLPYEFTSAEIRDLATLGVVVARNSVSKGLVVANGVTAALPNSMFHNIANFRIVQYVLHCINACVDDLIGESYIPVVTPKEIERRIVGVLTDIRDVKKYIRDFEIPAISYNQKKLSGTIQVSFIPRFTVEKVSASAVIRFER